MPQISIIIPYYNAASSIKNTLQSLLVSAEEVSGACGSMPWLQLVCIDNGSSDTSASIIKAYWESSFNPQQTELCMAHENARGVSHARNCGLTHTTGEYIGFVDADDTVSKRFFPALSEALADMPDIVHIRNEFKANTDVKTSRYLSLEGFLCKGFSGWWCWSFLFHTDLVSKHRFCGNCYEDFGLFPLLLNRATRFAVINESIYNYNRSSSGLTSQAFAWRCQEWDRQWKLLHKCAPSLSRHLLALVTSSYYQNRIVLRSLAGRPPVLVLADSINYLQQADSLSDVLARFRTLLYRNAVALRQFLKNRVAQHSNPF